jgi:hypothetical protein
MAGKRRGERKKSGAELPLQGNRLLKPIRHLIERLHGVGAERDHAGNRQLFLACPPKAGPVLMGIVQLAESQGATHAKTTRY